ncbi:thiamine pyrophosphate-dependent dehydrogenase E1 component subunit alpha [Hyphococcus sp.]|uniref:thiamine pyrophosphate-dependent dehydrogenase E1 component subunit alpha n=1 Tax=Hyphococcus sp. TaxID=2038636 RepID=UPI003CCBB774
MKAGVDQRLEMYKMMFTSRRYEEAIQAVYFEEKLPNFNMANGPIPGEMHLSMGQEPCAAGVCIHLTKDDYVSATHRPHHIAIAKGVDLNRMTAEIFGRSSGLSGGRGGHMHLFDTEVNFSCSGIVGQGIAPAVGAALSFKMRNLPHVAIAFIGEGAANQGAFHESMNLAGLWKVPFICVIEDNAYGISVDKKTSTAVPRNDIRAAGYGMPGIYIEGNDPDAVYAAAGEAIGRARAGGGPTLIEIETDRLTGHFTGDPETYRPEGEKEKISGRDALPAYRTRLLEEGEAPEEIISEIERLAEEVVRSAIEFARAAPEPPPEDAMTTVFA